MPRFLSHRLSSAAMPFLHRLDPERAHLLALRALRAGIVGQDRSTPDPALSVTAFGLRFNNPIGLAAGFDKNAVAVSALMRAGFGFVEAGTVTPLPQSGNPRPRLFRLPEDRAVINRFGFNSDGIHKFVNNIGGVPRKNIPLGVNIGINKNSQCAEKDYAYLVSEVAFRADYITINVSSPNTPGLIALQRRDPLRAILESIRRAVPRIPPLLIKLSPDLPLEALSDVIETAVAYGVAGLVISNTTIARPLTLGSRHAREVGGLSGRPLFAASTLMLKHTAELTRGRLILIGSGGIASGGDILTKIRAGATLVQLYSELAYSGLSLIPRLRHELKVALIQQGFARVSDAIGVDIR